ncbi:SEL1-like repeat protein [Shewanella sp. UCD-KL21]|uniref:SEL1-like repeat protein n=1 Tax=Shewanella sp. UCD-KL21 TaxID=1917164 RepID=UPI000970B6D1|nr:SEL1-like repeat protein [Shewanella sp. UCD-KL21]
MYGKKAVMMMLAIITLASCASYRDANIDGYSVINGGFTDRKVMDGLFYVEVHGGSSAISNLSSVAKNWKKRAAELCAGEFQKFEYQALDVKQPYSYYSPNALTIDYYVSQASGYAVCATYDGEMTEINNLISGRSTEINKAIETETLFLKKGCDDTTQSIVDLENAGVSLFKEKKYLAAKNIFYCVYQKDEYTLTQKKSYEILGTMNELGLGMDKDMKQAMFWYQKAGLLPK